MIASFQARVNSRLQKYNATDALLLACHLRERGMTEIFRLPINTAITSMRFASPFRYHPNRTPISEPGSR
jgi:hypothetical protein